MLSLYKDTTITIAISLSLLISLNAGVQCKIKNISPDCFYSNQSSLFTQLKNTKIQGHTSKQFLNNEVWLIILNRSNSIGITAAISVEVYRIPSRIVPDVVPKQGFNDRTSSSKSLQKQSSSPAAIDLSTINAQNVVLPNPILKDLSRMFASAEGTTP